MLATHCTSFRSIATPFLWILLGAFVVLAPAAGAQTPGDETPAHEGVCDGLLDATPGLYGLCVAHCEAQDAPADSRLLDVYERIRRDGDPDMPCICPCWSREELESISPNPDTDSWIESCWIGDGFPPDRDSIHRSTPVRRCGPHPGCRHEASSLAGVPIPALAGFPDPDVGLQCTYLQTLVPGLPTVVRERVRITQEAYEICRDQIRARQIELGIADTCLTN